MTPLQGQYQDIVPFLKKHCLECHGPDDVEGGIRLDNVNKIDASLWIDIYDQIAEGDMPPEEATSQLPEKLRKEILELVDAISRDDRFTIASGYRRLNKREYRNTVRDLLGLSEEFYDPAAFIFDDEIEKGFDTNSESLFISNDLLLEYLRSSTLALKTALHTEATEKPPVKKTTFPTKQLVVQGQLSSKTKNYVQRQRKGGIYPVDYDAAIPTTGNYRITADAAGLDRNPKLPAPGTPFRMELLATFAGTTKVLHKFDIQDEEFSPHGAVVWLEKGAKPYFQGATISGKPRNINRKRKESQKFSIPGLAIKNITIEGPLDVEWPPPPKRRHRNGFALV